MPWAWVGDNTIKMAKNGKKLLVGIGLVILIMISMQPQNTKKEGFINRYGYSSQAECESRIDDFSDPCKTSCNLITPDIFNYLDQAMSNLQVGDELYYNDALKLMLKDKKQILACEIKNGHYYDTGDKLEYLKTVIEFALQHKDINEGFRAYLKNLKI